LKRVRLLQDGLLKYEYSVDGTSQMDYAREQLFGGMLTAIHGLADEIGTVLQTINVGNEKLGSRLLRYSNYNILMLVSDDLRTDDLILLLKVEILARRFNTLMREILYDPNTADFLGDLIDQEDFNKQIFKDIEKVYKIKKLFKILDKLESPHSDIENLIKNLLSELPSSQLMLDHSLIYSKENNRIVVPAQLNTMQRNELLERLRSKCGNILGNRFVDLYFKNINQY